MSEIKVVPCRWHETGFHLSKENAIIWPDGHHKCCVIKAEALAKKAELERIKVDGPVPSSEASGKLDSGSTAAQNATEQDADDASKSSAVETRPPAPTPDAKLREWEEKEAGHTESRNQKYDKKFVDRIMAPAASLVCCNRNERLGGDNHESGCKVFPDPRAEQAAPPRPLLPTPTDERYSGPKGKLVRAPAAIEQARPQTPRYDAEEHKRILQSPLYEQLGNWDYIFDLLFEQQITPGKAIEALSELSLGLTPALPEKSAAAEPAPERTPPTGSVTLATNAGVMLTPERYNELIEAEDAMIRFSKWTPETLAKEVWSREHGHKLKWDELPGEEKSLYVEESEKAWTIISSDCQLAALRAVAVPEPANPQCKFGVQVKGSIHFCILREAHTDFHAVYFVNEEKS